MAGAVGPREPRLGHHLTAGPGTRSPSRARHPTHHDQREQLVNRINAHLACALIVIVGLACLLLPMLLAA